MTTEAETGSEAAKTEVKETAGAGKYTYEQLEAFREEAIADNVKLRTKHAEYKTRIGDLEQQARKADELEKEVTTLKTSARVEVAQARLEALAVKEGIVDPDALKLIDLSELKFDDNGKPENLKALLESFKEAKPHFFTEGAAKSASTSSTAKMPKADSTTPNAKDLSDAAWTVRKQQLGL